MRVLVLSSLYPSQNRPRHGIFIENRILHLRATRRIDVRVLCPVPWFPFSAKWLGEYATFARVPQREHRHGIEVRYPRFPAIPKIGSALTPLLMCTAVEREAHRLRNEGFDFEMIDAYYLYPDGVAATMLGARLNKPVVISALGSDVNVLPQYAYARAMIRNAALRAQGITTVCAALKDSLAALGIPGDRVDIIYHGVDAALFHPPLERGQLRAQLGLHRRTLLAVGNLVPLKGFDIAVHALTHLPEVDLVIIGSGQEEQALLARAAQLDLTQRVRILGNIGQAKLAQWYGAADALVIPSSSEGIPNVALEAMACGTPVIATAVGGLPEIVDQPDAGQLMSDRTADALVRAAQLLFERPRNEKATRALALRFSWERTRCDHLAVLDRALKAHSLIVHEHNNRSYTDR